MIRAIGKTIIVIVCLVLILGKAMRTLTKTLKTNKP